MVLIEQGQVVMLMINKDNRREYRVIAAIRYATMLKYKRVDKVYIKWNLFYLLVLATYVCWYGTCDV